MITTKNTICDVCSFGCPIACKVEDGAVKSVAPDRNSCASRGYLCAKGYANRQYIYHNDRLKTPLMRVGMRGEGKFQPISWDKAFEIIGEKIGSIKSEYGPDSALFYTGYDKWYRPFFHRLAHSFGTLNYATESSSCFQATVVANKCSSGCMSSPDLKNSGVLLAWAFNPIYSNLPTPNLDKHKQRGLKIIVIDPKITPASQKYGDIHLRPIPGTDGALASFFAREFIHNDFIDLNFIDEYVLGFESYAAYVEKYNVNLTSEITGISKELLMETTALIINNAPMSILEGNAGMIHHRNGVQNFRAVNALLAITGAFKKPGGNKTYKLGDPSGSALLAGESFIKEQRPKNAKPKVGSDVYPLWCDCIDEAQAMDIPRQIREGTPYPIKAIIALGFNARMFPSSSEMFDALKSLDFFVDVDLFMNDTAKYADIVLPACSSFERVDMRSTPDSVYFVEKAIEPLYESRSDLAICCDLARALNLDDELLTSGVDACFEYMLKDLPFSLSDLRKKGQINVGVQADEELRFYTPSGKYELYSSIIEKHELPPLPVYYEPYDNSDTDEFPMRLCSGGRLPGSFHSRYHRVSWARSLRPEASIDINPTDAERLKIRNGDWVKLSTKAGSITARANITIAAMENVVHMYHGYSEADVNSIIPMGHNDPYSGFPGYRSIRCRIEKGAAK